MKRVATLMALSVTLCSMALINGCQEDSLSYTYTVYEPVYMSWDELRSSVAIEAPRAMQDAGKIWVYNNYLFINEPNEGIHVLDNSDPRSPQFLSFIAVPGNYDMAAYNNILYADSYVDLLAIDISDPANPRVANRIEDIFPYQLYRNGVQLNPEEGVVVRWEEKQVTEKGRPFYHDEFGFNGGMRRDMGGPNFTPNAADSPSLSKGGSMARFTIMGKYLYTVDNRDMQLFSLNNPQEPVVWAKVNIGNQIETIFPYRDKLFIGSEAGMYIYDNSNPANPTYISEFLHVRSCDPVVAQGDYAYVTLRSGTRCQGFTNQLEIVDISDITNPTLVETYAMQNPHGLGINGNTLYICDGAAGLKVFDVENKKNIEINSHVSSIETYDVIPLGNLAIVIGPGGLHQYDCADPTNISLLSTIQVH